MAAARWLLRAGLYNARLGLVLSPIDRGVFTQREIPLWLLRAARSRWGRSLSAGSAGRGGEAGQFGPLTGALTSFLKGRGGQKL